MNKKNAILICVEGDQVKTKVCSEGAAQSALVAAREHGLPASVFISDGDHDQENVLACSQDLRARVNDAVLKAQRQLDLKKALDHEGVPGDREYRLAIYRAIKQWSPEVAA